MALQSERIYVNLPIKDVQKSIDFFSKLGFEFQADFTGETSACMIVCENIYVMMLTEDYFQTFTKKDVADATKTAEVIIALSAESREKVDELVDTALAAGGTISNEPADHGFMYVRSFQDLDGHLWEFAYWAGNQDGQE